LVPLAISLSRAATCGHFQNGHLPVAQPAANHPFWRLPRRAYSAAAQGETLPALLPDNFGVCKGDSSPRRPRNRFWNGAVYLNMWSASPAASISSRSGRFFDFRSFRRLRGFTGSLDRSPGSTRRPRGAAASPRQSVRRNSAFLPLLVLQRGGRVPQPGSSAQLFSNNF
jgi:hypothetical protein